MLVFRKKFIERPTAECIGRLERLGGALLRGATHEGALELLMEWGEFETGVADFLFQREDSVSEISSALRKTGILTGHLFMRAWEGRGAEGALAKEFLASLNTVRAFKPPKAINIREPEGYAHYGLYPETYIEAARMFYSAERPAKAVCIGLRSIGTSLSNAVAAALEALGCETASYTVRPREHPFRRKSFISARLAEELKRRYEGGASFLIVDEGPGMSGTSFTGVADALTSLGIGGPEIIFFPSWMTDGAGFVNAHSRKVWNRHRKYAGDFDGLWIRNGRLAGGLGAKGLIDVSAGMWRRLFYRNEKDYPAVHPHHEKRKFLAQNGRVSMLRFAGHGRYGRGKLERAERLFQDGFTPRPMGLKNGFLVSDFIEGRPISINEKNQVLLEEMAGYLARLRASFRAPHEVTFDELAEMVERNITLGLGEQWASTLGDIERFRMMYEDAVPVDIDGRMLPNEWLITKRGYMKADALDHHADQFFPRSLDIAWDIAGAMTEFGFGPMEEDYFIGKYRALSGDRDVRDRLPFYSVAYLAYRLGFATFAARELASTSDGLRFEALKRKYSLELKRAIIAAST